MEGMIRNDLNALPLFADHLEQPGKPKDEVKILETQFAYMMLKTMDQSSSNGGLLGDKNQGIGHFRDLFFMNMAEIMVDSKAGQGIKSAIPGFPEVNLNAYQKNYLDIESGSD